MTAYLRPTAPIAADVLLPADPGLAMELAQRLTSKPLMANHHHGLWGYSGRTEAGRELTVQAAGIGGPSTAAVVAELAAHGARRVIRIGTCAALDGSLVTGEAIVVASALGADGTTAALGAELTRPDRDLTESLAGAARRVEAVSFDLGEGAGPALREAWAGAGIAVVDRETASLLAVSGNVGVAAAAALVVNGAVKGEEAEEAVITAALLDLGVAAADALRRVVSA